MVIKEIACRIWRNPNKYLNLLFSLYVNYGIWRIHPLPNPITLYYNQHKHRGGAKVKHLEVCAAILLKDNKVLCAQRNKGKYDMCRTSMNFREGN